MRLKKLQWFATSNAASDSQLDLNHNGHQPCRQNRRSEARRSNLSVLSGHGANDNGVSVHPLAPCTCGRRVPMRSGQVNTSKNQRHPAAPTLHLRLPARASIIGTGTEKLSPAKNLPMKTRKDKEVDDVIGCCKLCRVEYGQSLLLKHNH
jgi:hypothetical protein